MNAGDQTDDAPLLRIGVRLSALMIGTGVVAVLWGAVRMVLERDHMGPLAFLIGATLMGTALWVRERAELRLATFAMGGRRQSTYHRRLTMAAAYLLMAAGLAPLQLVFAEVFGVLGVAYLLSAAWARRRGVGR